jgi:signal transduction histidine kinase
MRDCRIRIKHLYIVVCTPLFTNIVMTNPTLDDGDSLKPFEITDTEQMDFVFTQSSQFPYDQKVIVPLLLIREQLKQLTDKERAESELAMRRLSVVETILNSLGGPVIYVDPEFNILYANLATNKLVKGLYASIPADEEIEGKNLKDFSKPQELESYAKLMQTAVQGRQIFINDREIEGRFHRITNIPIFAGDVFTGIVRFFSDATVLKAEERVRVEFEQRLATLQSSFQVSQIVNQIAHDINNILAGILGNSELLKDSIATGEVAPTETKEMLDAIIDQAHYLKTMTHSLRDVAREQNPHFETIFADYIIHELRRLLANNPRVAGTQTIYATDEVSKNTQISVDMQLLQRALTNLVINAAEAILSSPKPPSDNDYITVTITDAGDMTRIEVSDTGPGIPDARISDLFVNSFTTKQTGSGQGLLVVQRIAKAHGGSVTVKSKVGNGTIFTILLPKVHDE